MGEPESGLGEAEGLLPGVVGVAIEEEDPGVEGLMAGEPTGDAIVTAVPGEDSADGPGDAVAPAAGGEGDAGPNA